MAQNRHVFLLDIFPGLRYSDIVELISLANEVYSQSRDPGFSLERQEVFDAADWLAKDICPENPFPLGTALCKVAMEGVAKVEMERREELYSIRGL